MNGEAMARFMSLEEIQSQVDSFFSEYYPAGIIPIPVEEIIDIKMGINIIPIPGLRDAYSSEGFLSNDLQSIWVDEYAASHYDARFRFTSAHELGHLVLHREFYESVQFESTEQWLEIVGSLSEKDHGRFEFQANEFAGRLLVPRDVLIERMHSRAAQLREKGISIEELMDQSWEFIYDDIADDFQVSGGVIQRRVNKENLLNLFREK